MTSNRRLITTLVTLLAVIVAGAAVYLYTARSMFQTLQSKALHQVTAASRSGGAQSVEQLRSTMLTAADLPPGSTFQVMPITPELLNASTPEMLVRPESCLGSLKVALGGTQVAGFMQVGSQPTSDGRRPFESAVGTANGGLSIDKMRRAVGTCTSGTISWPALNVTATISLSEVPVAQVKGGSTFAYKSTMSYTNVTASQLQALAVCSAPDVPENPIVPAGNTSDVSLQCTTVNTSTNQPMNFTVVQYVGYAVGASAYVEACAAEVAQVNQMLSVPFARLHEAGYV